MTSGGASRGGVQGWKEFIAEKRDLSRAFESAMEKSANKPIKTEPGSVAEAVFRAWLTEFLPARYGVTSGYIVSPGLTDTDLLRHFDVIIYDRLEAPLLWRELNLDHSIQGRRRPIPVEHVLAVLEVKASLTKEAARNAVSKLQELKPLMGHDAPDELYLNLNPPIGWCDRCVVKAKCPCVLGESDVLAIRFP